MKVDVIWLLGALRIDYQRVGRLAWARCPSRAHNDSTPSWRVILDEADPRYGQHRCYGCGFGGYGTHLIAEVLGLTKGEARKWAIEKGDTGGLPTQVMLMSSPGMPVGHAGFALPAGTMTQDELPLCDWPEAALRYLEQRGITLTQAERWGLAVCPTTATDEGRPAKYRGRVVIPVRDQHGRLVSHTARSYTGSPVRYMTPQLSDGADLDAVFGAEFWTGESTGTCVVVEAAMNALAVERVAPHYEIASLQGSNPTALQLFKLSRFQRLLLALDPDPAGEKAALTIHNALSRAVEMRRVCIPPGHDPANLEPDVLGALLERAEESFDRDVRPVLH